MATQIVFGRTPPTWTTPLSVHGVVLDRPLAGDTPIDAPLILTDYADIDFAERNGTDFPFRFCPSYATAKLLDSPISFSRWMAWNGFARYAPQPVALETFPCVVKEDRGASGGEGVHMVKKQRHFESLTIALHEKRIGWLIQEAIAGHFEYVAHQLVIGGIVLTSIVFQIRLTHSLEIKRGSRGGRRVELDLSPLDEIYRLLNYTGFSAVNFKVVAGVMKIFEINPRLGASLVLNPTALAEMIGAFKEALVDAKC